MASKTDPIVGISSFNNSETIASCRLWRRKVVTNAAASSFRSSGSLTAACSAVRRRTIQLNRQLGLRMDVKNPKASQTAIADDEFSAIHELLRLVGNVTFFDVMCRLAVKDADVVQPLGVLLEFDDLKLDIAASVIRLFANLCESKESTASVLQTKPCVRMIVYWLTKNLDDDLARNLEETSTAPKRLSKDNRSEYYKLREQCIRALRNAASCGKNFAHYLIRSEAVYAVGRCLRILENKPETKNVRDTAFQFLQLLLPFKDHNYSQQLLRADILEKLMDMARSAPANATNVDAATKLILGMVSHYSSLRCDLSKFGAVEWMQERIEKMMEREKWAEEISGSDSSIDGDTLVALTRFCRDAYTRAKLRDTRALDLLLKIFISGELKQTKFFHELMSAFLCFLYDDQGLKYLVEFDGFLGGVVGIIDRFTADFPCAATHYSKDEAEEDDQAAVTTDSSSCEFRADSPSYKRFRLDPTAVTSSGDGEVDSFNGPLCKDFSSSAALNSGNWSSPSPSPPRNAPSPSSPGPAWSPSASSLHSLSSFGSGSPRLAGSKSSCWSPTSDSYRSADDNEYEWVQFECGRRYSNSSQDQTPPALCECPIPSTEEPSTYKDRERLLWAAVRLISWLSHSAHASLLVSNEFLSILLAYIAGVCRPEPRIGRLIERLTRNRLFTESLLALDFHQKVYDSLCVAQCGNGNEPKKQCGRCRKVSKIGFGIMKSFRAQVDTDFGFGTLEHLMANDDENTKIHCLCAVLYSMMSNWRAKRLMNGDEGGLNVLLHALASEETDNERRVMVVKALYAGLDKSALRDRLKWSSSSASTQSSRCLFQSSGPIPDEHRVTFLEKDGERKIDCNIDMLMALSPFYRAMFSGSYSESSRRHFVYDDDGVNSNFSSFIFYVHFLHGCRNCDQAPLNSAADCLSVLELADKRLCCSLGESVVSNLAVQFFQSDSMGHFISNAIMRRDLILFRFCMHFLFALCNVEEFLRLLTVFRTSPLGIEFFLMLSNYLKGEFKFE